MSFQSAMKGTQIAQRYRQQADELRNLDRSSMDQYQDYLHGQKMRDTAVGAFGDVVNLMGSAGKGLTGLSENLKTATGEGLEFSFKDALFGGGGFSKEGVGPMSLGQVGQTSRLQNLMKAYGVTGSFPELANIVTSENPYQGLLGYYNTQTQVPQGSGVGRVGEADLGLTQSTLNKRTTPYFNPYEISPAGMENY